MSAPLTPSVPAPAVSVRTGFPEWLGPLLQGVTLASVFAIGAWTGKIDTKVDEVLREQEQQRTDVKELSNQVAKLNDNLSYLQGVLQATKNRPTSDHSSAAQH
jgi:hypothetical protein